MSQHETLNRERYVHAVNGRFCRGYHCEGFWLLVTYHKPVRGRLRQLTISPKLLRKVLR